MDTDTTVSGDDYFSNMDEVGVPESNGDVTSPVGDIDSEATQEAPVAELDGGEDDSPTDDVEAPETDVEASDDTDEWLPGFEGRFRPGDEAKALASYQELEKAYSKKDQEFREQLAAERDAAFKQAAELLKQEKSAPTWQELEQQKGQLIGLALHDPQTAFQYALDSGDEASINAVIATVAQGDAALGLDGNPAAALEMQRLVTAAQTQAAIEEQRATLQQIQAERYADQAKAAFSAEYGEVLQVPEIQQEFAAVAQAAHAAGQFNSSSPEAIKGFLEDCLSKAYGRLAMKGQIPAPQAATTQAVDPHAGKKMARLEGGSPTRASRPAAEQKKDISDEYGDDLVAAAHAPRPY